MQDCCFCSFGKSGEPVHKDKLVLGFPVQHNNDADCGGGVLQLQHNDFTHMVECCDELFIDIGGSIFALAFAVQLRGGTDESGE